MNYLFIFQVFINVNKLFLWYLPKPLLNLLNSHSIALANEGWFISRMSQHNLIPVSRALSTSSLSSSISDRKCTGAMPSQNTLHSFSSSHRHKMMGNKCFLRNCKWSGTDSLTVAIEVLRSLRASIVGISPCTLALFRNGSTVVSMNS